MTNSSLTNFLDSEEFNNLTDREIFGTPEGTLVTIIETVFVSQAQGKLLRDILENIENHRKQIGENKIGFNNIKKF
jgi:hypothetical protein